jgi:hypothetical protein
MRMSRSAVKQGCSLYPRQGSEKEVAKFAADFGNSRNCLDCARRCREGAPRVARESK